MGFKKEVTIVGAGLAGCFLAICLAQKGYKVALYESRPDPRNTKLPIGRSYNIQLYPRGIAALKKIGLWGKDVRDIAVLVTGNVVHLPHGVSEYAPLEKKSKQRLLYQVHRDALHRLLLQKAASYSNVNIYFDYQCIRIDRKNHLIYFQSKDNQLVVVPADVVVGADGVYSVVRGELQDGEDALNQQEIFSWGYKEIHVSPKDATVLNLRPDATHTWPRNSALIIGFPNTDGSTTLMAMMPVQGRSSFGILTNEKTISGFVKRVFPDLLPILPTITESFMNHPMGKFVSIITRPWFYKDFIVLIGDAAHGVVPFYGQGMNSAFEDGIELTRCLETYADRQRAFSQFQERRKRHTDALAQLAKDNFFELRDASRSPRKIIREKIDTVLHMLFPRFWLPPMYRMVAHTTVPYADIVTLYRKQDRKALFLGVRLLVILLAGMIQSSATVRLVIRQSARYLKKPYVRSVRYQVASLPAK